MAEEYNKDNLLKIAEAIKKLDIPQEIQEKIMNLLVLKISEGKEKHKNLNLQQEHLTLREAIKEALVECSAVNVEEILKVAENALLLKISK